MEQGGRQKEEKEEKRKMNKWEKAERRTWKLREKTME